MDLLLLPPQQVTSDLLDQLVADRVVEGFTLEYKRELGNGAKALSGISAMANTFGGVLLVGIDEEVRPDATGFGAPGPDGVVGVERKDRARLASMCSSQFAPPFDPQIHAVELTTGKVVLVVRIYPELAPRPLMYAGRILVRTEAGNRPADLFRLRMLFNEGSAGSSAIGILPSSATPFNHAAFGEEPPADLIVRAIGAVPLVPTSGRPKLTDIVRQELRALLSSAPINEWLGRVLTATGGTSVTEWRTGGWSSSRRAELRWLGHLRGTLTYPEARLVAELPALGPATTVTFHLDLIFRLSAVGDTVFPDDRQGLRWRLTVEDLYRLFEAVLASFSTLSTAVGALLGATAGRPAGPMVGLITREGAPISDVVDTQEFRVVGQVGSGGSLQPDPELDPSAVDDRRTQATEWLRELLLDVGLEGVDQVIQKLTG